MKALLQDQLPRGPQWIYEIKFDGIRALAIKNGNAVKLLSRNQKDLSAKYAEITKAVEALSAIDLVLDGEIVAVDDQGRSSFQLLQSCHSADKRPSLLYYVFDLLVLNGRDVTRLPLAERKTLAEQIMPDSSALLRFSSSFQKVPAKLAAEMKKRGLEGLIAKKADSLYEPGRRSGAWVKCKWTNEQEFLIGGYTCPRGGRSFFGAILVGFYGQDRLLFAGKVGTGFDERTLRDLHRRFQPLIRPNCPFANLPEKIPGAGGQGMTAGKMKLCTWLAPRLVCQVRFAEWTRDHHLRQPAFLGMRQDKNPREVVREI
jgi:bifunctional non-homologous end joining protein LigD